MVRDRKGEVRRAYRLPPAGRARTIDRPEMPPRYSGFRRVDDRDRVMSLLPLTGGYPHVKNLAPDYLRPIFIRVLLDCMGYGDPV